MARPTELRLPSASLKDQASNKAEWNNARSTEDADFYTIGYAGRDIGEFVTALVDAEISTLLDIRHAPVSMYKPAFSKKNLMAALAERGIDYLHERDLGVPRDIRGKAVGKPDRGAIWDWYDAHVIPRFAGANLHWLLNVADHPVALMCVEADPTECHRHRLALALERHGLRCFDL